MGISPKDRRAMNMLVAVACVFLVTGTLGLPSVPEYPHESLKGWPNCPLAVNGECVEKPELTCVRSKCSMYITDAYYRRCMGSPNPKQCITSKCKVPKECITCICTILDILAVTSSECVAAKREATGEDDNMFGLLYN